jgi:hypothetical protein
MKQDNQLNGECEHFSSFPLVKDRFIFNHNPQDRQLFLLLIPLLHSVQRNYFGINQLQSNFYPDFEHWGGDVLGTFN